MTIASIGAPLESFTVDNAAEPNTDIAAKANFNRQQNFSVRRLTRSASASSAAAFRWDVGGAFIRSSYPVSTIHRLNSVDTSIHRKRSRRWCVASAAAIDGSAKVAAVRLRGETTTMSMSM